VHPLEHDSSPYSWDGEDERTRALLASGARALNFSPKKPPQSFMTLLNPHSATASRYTASGGIFEPLDKRYTGYITITNYQVAFVLPKEFPPHPRTNGTSELRSRRTSFGEKTVQQYMACIRLFVSYTSKPPRAPWLVRLFNGIKRRV
jgi:hypothetical protein